MSSKRMFIAFSFDEEIKQRITQSQNTLRNEMPTGIKWVGAESFHITAKFLGDTDEHLIPQITQIMEETLAEQQRQQIQLKELGVFPTKKNPRILWLGTIGAKELLNHVHSQLENNLENLGFAKETKFSGFNPHITLGRVKHLPQNFFPVFEAHKDIFVTNCEINALTLYESQSVQSGKYKKVIYKPLACVHIS
ncbi:RNA 2',3'-cyclic phosphodiesterase [Candidatus Uabimicrobium sp. HlEnr_7]|uniref:RNA 2',3'-cyclic phosphodiesterase n=1 Tax=Candidatus Uabimicrobium helgolandensis TaxID=3095367 RepID=UPI003557446D